MANPKFRLYYIVLAGDLSGLSSGERLKKSSEMAETYCRALEKWLDQNNLKSGEDYGLITKLNMGQISIRCTKETAQKLQTASQTPASGLPPITEVKLGLSADMSMAERVNRSFGASAGLNRSLA